MQKKNSLLDQNFNIEKIVGSNETDNEAKGELEPQNPFRINSGILIEKFVDHYEKRCKQNRVLRVIFFVLSFLSLLAIICVFSAVAILASSKETINVEAVISIIGSGATMLTSILVLPKMVGKNLFPEKEDNEILNFVKQMNETELGFMRVRNHVDDENQDLKKP